MLGPSFCSLSVAQWPAPPGTILLLTFWDHPSAHFLWLNGRRHPGPSFCSLSGTILLLTFCGSMAGATRDHPSAHFLWLNGRRHPSFRNDFNWQRRETARIATLSQQLFFRLDGKWGPAKLFGEPQRPPTWCVQGAGGWRAISRPQTELQCASAVHHAKTIAAS